MSNTLLVQSAVVKRKPNTITIISMAKRVKMPECDIYIDVASFMVDDFEYKMSGLEPFIQNTLYKLHEDFFVDLCSLLERLPIESGILVMLCCTAGDRRSVASVELLARKLRSTRKVEVHHKELEKWLKF